MNSHMSLQLSISWKTESLNYIVSKGRGENYSLVEKTRRKQTAVCSCSFLN